MLSTSRFIPSISGSVRAPSSSRSSPARWSGTPATASGTTRPMAPRVAWCRCTRSPRRGMCGRCTRSAHEVVLCTAGTMTLHQEHADAHDGHGHAAGGRVRHQSAGDVAHRRHRGGGHRRLHHRRDGYRAPREVMRGRGKLEWLSVSVPLARSEDMPCGPGASIPDRSASGQKRLASNASITGRSYVSPVRDGHDDGGRMNSHRASDAQVSRRSRVTSGASRRSASARYHASYGETEWRSAQTRDAKGSNGWSSTSRSIRSWWVRAACSGVRISRRSVLRRALVTSTGMRCGATRTAPSIRSFAHVVTASLLFVSSTMTNEASTTRVAVTRARRGRRRALPGSVLWSTPHRSGEHGPGPG